MPSTLFHPAIAFSESESTHLPLLSAMQSNCMHRRLFLPREIFYQIFLKFLVKLWLLFCILKNTSAILHPTMLYHLCPIFFFLFIFLASPPDISFSFCYILKCTLAHVQPRLLSVHQLRFALFMLELFLSALSSPTSHPNHAFTPDRAQVSLIEVFIDHSHSEML